MTQSKSKPSPIFMGTHRPSSSRIRPHLGFIVSRRATACIHNSGVTQSVHISGTGSGGTRHLIKCPLLVFCLSAGLLPSLTYLSSVECKHTQPLLVVVRYRANQSCFTDLRFSKNSSLLGIVGYVEHATITCKSDVDVCNNLRADSQIYNVAALCRTNTCVQNGSPFLKYLPGFCNREHTYFQGVH